MHLVLQIINKNKLAFAYLLLLVCLPLFFSSGITYSISKYYWFFKALKPLDLTIVFFILSITMTFALTPTTFICLAGGFIWGWHSLIYILPSYVLAQVAGYYLARLVDGKKMIQSLQQINKMPDVLHRIQDNKIKVVLLCRLSPVLPFALMNMVLSLLRVDFKTFIWAGQLGMLPRSLLVIWLGTQLSSLMNGLSGNTIYIISFIILSIFSLGGIFKILTKIPLQKKRNEVDI